MNNKLKDIVTTIRDKRHWWDGSAATMHDFLEDLADKLDDLAQDHDDAVYLAERAKLDLTGLVRQPSLGQYTPVTMVDGPLAGLMAPIRTGPLQKHDTFSIGGVKYRYGEDGKGYHVEDLV